MQIFVSTRMGAVREMTREFQPDSDHASYRVLRQLNFRVRLVTLRPSSFPQ